MMETIPVLRLNQQHVAQLTAHCTAYRAYLWQHLLPSPERNQELRAIQALQGRLLIAAQEPTQAEIALPLSAEESSIFHHLVGTLMHQWEAEPASEKQTSMCAEFAMWRTLLERLPRRTHGRGSHKDEQSRREPDERKRDV